MSISFFGYSLEDFIDPHQSPYLAGGHHHHDGSAVRLNRLDLCGIFAEARVQPPQNADLNSALDEISVVVVAELYADHAPLRDYSVVHIVAGEGVSIVELLVGEGWPEILFHHRIRKLQKFFWASFECSRHLAMVKRLRWW